MVYMTGSPEVLVASTLATGVPSAAFSGTDVSYRAAVNMGPSEDTTLLMKKETINHITIEDTMLIGIGESRITDTSSHLIKTCACELKGGFPPS